MYYKGNLDSMPFITLLVMLFLTIWSRISIKCEKSKDIIFNLIFGIIWGVLFYYFVKDYYLNAESGKIEKATCDLGYENGDYKCSEIKDGQVIVKN